MIPADQRLEPDDRAVEARHDGLVDEPELPCVERDAQLLDAPDDVRGRIDDEKTTARSRPSRLACTIA